MPEPISGTPAQIAAAMPPLTPADIERLRPIVAPLFKAAAEQLAARDGAG